MRKFTFLLLTVLIFTSCKSRKNVAVTELTTSEMEKKQFTSLFIKATNLAMVENFDNAIDLYKKCLELQPKNAATYYELSRMYGKKRNAQLAVLNAEKAYDLKPKNKWYLLQKATVYRATGQQDKAILAYEELVKMDEKNLPVLYEMTQLYQQKNQYKKAAEVISKIEAIQGKSPQMSYQKYLLLMDAGEQKQAVDEIANLLKQDPKNGMGNLAMAQHYQKSGQEEKVYQRLIYVFEDGAIRTDTKLSILMDYTSKMQGDAKKEEEALNLINIMKKVHPTDVKPFVAAGDFYQRKGELKEANNNYTQGLEYAKNSFPIYIQLIDNQLKLKDYQGVVNSAESAIESYPTQPAFYLYKGLGYSAQENYEKAISAYKTGKNVVVDDEKLEFDFYSKLGEAYNEVKDYENSDKYFDKALTLNGLEPFMLNNYSYFLSLRKAKLEKAAEMSRKAVNVFPSNASFLDTYGWILFQQGNFTEAEIWIKKSLDNGGDKSGTVLEHYGDVMIQLKKENDALRYWKLAKENGEHTDKIIDKIRDKKYYE